MRMALSIVAFVGLLSGPPAVAASAVPAPPLERQYGDRLDIRRLEMSDPMGVDLYRAAARMLALAPDAMVVPLLLASVGPARRALATG